MGTYTPDQWEKSEETVSRRAEKAAYKASENITDRKVQLLVYRMTKDNIVLGARMMKEELLKFEDNGK